MFIRQRNVKTLCTEIINPCDFEDLPAKVKESLNHGKNFESRARELYIDVMRLKLRQFVLVHETGLITTILVLVSCFYKWTCCITNQ